MSLEKITDKLHKLYQRTISFAKKEKKYLCASSALFASSISDAVITTVGIHMYNKEELSFIPRYFIEQFGTINGPLIISAVIFPLILSASYGLNKSKTITDYFPKKIEIGTGLMYVIATIKTCISAYNLFTITSS